MPPGGPVPPPGQPPYGWPTGALPPAQSPTRRNTLPLITSAVLLVLLALVAIPLVLRGGDDDTEGTATGSPGQSGSDTIASPTPPPPVTPEEYQGALTALDSAFTTSLSSVSKARTPATVRNATDALATLARSEASKLEAITPPEVVAPTHSRLVTALDALSSSLASASIGGICAGSSAVPMISRQNAVNSIRLASQELATTDPTRPYKVGSWLPKEANDPNRKLANGKFIKKTGTTGSGQLKIKNNGKYDAVVSITPEKSKTPTIIVYVGAKKNYTVRGIKAGTYNIYLTSGTDWDTTGKTFSRDCDFGRFDQSFKFTNTSTMYTIWEITLAMSAGGNAPTSSVNPDDFPVG